MITLEGLKTLAEAMGKDVCDEQPWGNHLMVFLPDSKNVKSCSAAFHPHKDAAQFVEVLEWVLSKVDRLILDDEGYRVQRSYLSWSCDWVDDILSKNNNSFMEAVTLAAIQLAESLKENSNE